MIRITTVIGARPQFIKASVMSQHFAKEGIVKEVLIHTGQHFDANMSDIFFSELQMPSASYNLGIHSTSHGKMTGQMIIGIEEALLKEKPHYLLVYGDTNSTLAGALAARKLQIPIIHVEAGLRSGNNRMPEEINRIVTDRISDLLCCPTDRALNNLVREGFNYFDCVFQQTGDIMEDALRYHEKHFASASAILDKFGIQPGQYILCTIHRAENTDDPERLQQIMIAINEIAAETKLIVPLHPGTRKKISVLPTHRNLHFIDPVGYAENLQLIKKSSAVMTDSGGMQKEAYMMKKFCITLRDETEWTELSDCSCNFLAGAEKEKILDTYRAVKNMKWNAEEGIYGGGRAGSEIHKMIVQDAQKRGIL
jgi:UDP-GlcNAc3NAcA epimerase